MERSVDMNQAGVIFFLIFLFVSSVGYARTGGGDISFPIKGQESVTFSHDRHVGAAGLTCTGCHASLYSTAEKHKKATMVQMQQGKSCGACHNGNNAFDVKGNCSNCHKKI
jgi:c(7)-type cytochrome triheme protein